MKFTNEITGALLPGTQLDPLQTKEWYRQFDEECLIAALPAVVGQLTIPAHIKMQLAQGLSTVGYDYIGNVWRAADTVFENQEMAQHIDKQRVGNNRIHTSKVLSIVDTTTDCFRSLIMQDVERTDITPVDGRAIINTVEAGRHFANDESRYMHIDGRDPKKEVQVLSYVATPIGQPMEFTHGVYNVAGMDGNFSPRGFSAFQTFQHDTIAVTRFNDITLHRTPIADNATRFCMRGTVYYYP